MSNTTTTSNPMFVPSMTDTDTGMGWIKGDQITIVAGGKTAKQIDNYKKVHVARRRHAKKLIRTEAWRLEDILSPTTFTASRNP